MKNQSKRLLSLLMLLAMVCTIFVSISVPTAAASYVANWGERGELCTELSSYAQAFYTGAYVFDDMSQTQGGSSQSNAYQSALYGELQALMQSKHTYETSYAATRDLYKYTDCQNGDTTTISSFYSGKSLSGTWDSGATWNREHTWPDSKGLNGNDENDIMMLRPTSVSENSSRGNKAYGESSGYYDPNSESDGAYDLRGDVARICLYVYVRWENTSYMWGSDGVMESLAVLLEWMEADPVDTWEMGRNDSVQSITGTRNVFVDYPEYAWLLFGEDVPEDITTPSGNAGATGGTISGGSTDSGTTGGTTDDTTGDSTATEMTVEQALAAADDTIITVTGTITSIDSQYGWSGTSMSAYLGDGNGNEIYLYKLTTEVEVGQNVTVTGKRYTHNGLNEIKDFTSVVINSSGNTGGNTDSGTTGDTTGGSGGTATAGDKVTYTFADYTAGVQYAANEVHVLDDVLTVTTNDAHFTTQLRLYHNNGDNGYEVTHGTAVFQSTKEIKAISLNAGKNADVLKISGSNDGENWTLIDEISVTASYADYDVNMNGGQYKFIKLESTAAQIRVASVTFEYVLETVDTDTGNGNGSATTPDPDTGNGDTTVTDPDNGNSDTTVTDPDNGNSDTTVTDPDDGNSDTTVTDPENGNGDTTVTDPDDGNGSTTTPDPDDGNGSTTTPDPDDSTCDDANSDGEDADNGEDIGELTPEPAIEKGCGSSVGGGAVILLSISLAGIAMLRKKENEQ